LGIAELKIHQVAKTTTNNGALVCHNTKQHLPLDIINIIGKYCGGNEFIYIHEVQDESEILVLLDLYIQDICYDNGVIFREKEDEMKEMTTSMKILKEYDIIKLFNVYINDLVTFIKIIKLNAMIYRNIDYIELYRKQERTYIIRPITKRYLINARDIQCIMKEFNKLDMKNKHYILNHLNNKMKNEKDPYKYLSELKNDLDKQKKYNRSEIKYILGGSLKNRKILNEGIGKILENI